MWNAVEPLGSGGAGDVVHNIINHLSFLQHGKKQQKLMQNENKN